MQKRDTTPAGEGHAQSVETTERNIDLSDNKKARLGPCYLAAVVLDDHVGTVYRAVRTEAFEYIEHWYVRIVADRFQRQGLLSKIQKLEHTRQFVINTEDVCLKATYFDVEGEVVFSSPYTPGQYLSRIGQKNLESPFLSLNDAIYLLLEMASGLARFHAAGISHGMLDLSSFYVSYSGEVVVVDGLYSSTLMELAFADSKASGDVPAVAISRATGAAGNVLDVAMLAAAWIHLLTGKGIDLSDPGFASRVRGLTLTDFYSDTKAVPDEITSILLKCFGVDGVFVDATELVVALDSVIEGGCGVEPSAFDFAIAMNAGFKGGGEIDIERDAVAHERSYEWRKADVATSTKVVTKWVQDKGFRNRVIAGGVVILGAAALVGGYLLRRSANEHQLAELAQVRMKAEQEAQAKELAKLTSDLDGRMQALTEEMSVYAQRIKNARTDAERAALEREAADKRVKAEAEIVALRNRINAVANKKIEPTVLPAPSAQVVPSQVPAEQKVARSALSPSAVSPKPSADTDNKVLPQRQLTTEDLKRLEKIQDQISFVKSEKAPLVVDDKAATEQAKAGESRAPALAGDPFVATAVSSARIRHMVMPSIPKDRLNGLEGKLVRVRVMIDEFGNARRVVVVDGVADLEPSFISAAMATKYNPSTVAGRPRGGWLDLSYRISGGGVVLF